MQKFLISVPHATAPETQDIARAEFATGGHPWDYSAPETGRMLMSALSAKGSSVKTFEADVNRATLDMNRSWSRKSGWRESIRAESGISVVIDVHSYPEGCAALKGFDLAIVTPGRPLSWQAELAGTLAGGARSGLVVSPCMTDIVREFESLGIPAVMIEFSEGLSKERSRTLVDAITAFLISKTKDTLALLPSPDSTCKVVDERVECYFVDSHDPTSRVRLWFPPTVGSSVKATTCAVCGKRSDRLCDACACVAYCGRECQEIDWERRKHWVVCSIVAMQRRERSSAVGCRAFERPCKCGSPSRFSCSLCGGTFCGGCPLGEERWITHFPLCYEDHIGTR